MGLLAAPTIEKKKNLKFLHLLKLFHISKINFSANRIIIFFSVFIKLKNILDFKGHLLCALHINESLP